MKDWRAQEGCQQRLSTDGCPVEDKSEGTRQPESLQPREWVVREEMEMGVYAENDARF